MALSWLLGNKKILGPLVDLIRFFDCWEWRVHVSIFNLSLFSLYTCGALFSSSSCGQYFCSGKEPLTDKINLHKPSELTSSLFLFLTPCHYDLPQSIAWRVGVGMVGVFEDRQVHWGCLSGYLLRQVGKDYKSRRVKYFMDCTDGRLFLGLPFFSFLDLVVWNFRCFKGWPGLPLVQAWSYSCCFQGWSFLHLHRKSPRPLRLSLNVFPIALWREKLVELWSNPE